MPRDARASLHLDLSSRSFRVRQSKLAGGGDRLPNLLRLRESDCGCLLSLGTVHLFQDFNPRSAVGVLKDLHVGFQPLLVLFELANLGLHRPTCREKLSEESSAASI